VLTLPVLFGTGIDLGVHAVHGGRRRPAEGIRLLAATFLVLPALEALSRRHRMREDPGDSSRRKSFEA
jgi:hypothetical protein